MRSTEQELRHAIADADRVLAGAGQSPYPRELFPELARPDRNARPDRHARPGAAAPAFAGTQAAAPAQAEHARPVLPALTPENVARWSHELGFGVSARQGRVTRDQC